MPRIDRTPIPEDVMQDIANGIVTAEMHARVELPAAELEQLRADLRAVTAERDKLVETVGRMISLPPETVADAYFVRYTGTGSAQP